MFKKFKRVDAKKIEIEQKERIVQTYLIVVTLLVTYNQNITAILGNLNTTTNSSNAQIEMSNDVLTLFTLFVICILFYNALLFFHANIPIREINNFIAIIASSCFSSLLIISLYKTLSIRRILAI